MSDIIDARTENNSGNLLDLGITLSNKSRLLFFTPLLAAAIAAACTFAITPTFTATTQLLPPQQQSAATALLGSLGGLAGSLGSSGLGAIAGLKNPADQWVGMLKSRTIADALLSRFVLKSQYGSHYMFEAREELEKRTRITVGKDGMIDIEVDDETPEKAARIADAYVEELQKLTQSLSTSEANQRKIFFEKQLSDINIKLISAEESLRSSGISQNLIKTSPEAAVTEIAILKAQLTAQEMRIDVLQHTLTPNSPDLKQAQAELRSLQEHIKKSETSDSQVPNKDGSSYIGRFREFKYQETLFELVAKQYELAKADEARTSVLIQVVDHAAIPEWKSKPKRATITLGTYLFVLFLLLAGILIKREITELQKDPIKSKKIILITSQLSALYKHSRKV